MKKFRTRKAVDAVLASRDRLRIWKEIHPNGHPDEWPAPKVLSAYRAARRFKVSESAISRALQRAEKFQRCDACKGKGFVKRVIKLAD